LPTDCLSRGADAAAVVVVDQVAGHVLVQKVAVKTAWVHWLLDPRAHPQLAKTWHVPTSDIAALSRLGHLVAIRESLSMMKAIHGLAKLHL